jgi:hypothetical protein
MVDFEGFLLEDRMIRRLVTLLLCAALLSLIVGPGSAYAHGPKLKGVVIEHSQTVTYKTGNCICVWSWFTLGLHPGKVSISLSVGKCTLAVSPICAAAVDLYRGLDKIKEASASCYIKHKSCKGSFKANIGTSGVYYILLRGNGANLIPVKLRIQGNIYPLHCKTYC